MELTLVGAHLGDVDVEIADRIDPELFRAWLVAIRCGQPADAVTLKTTMKRRARQTRDRGLKCIETVIEREKGVLAEGDDDRLLLQAENRRSRRLGTHRRILHVGALAPLLNRLGVDAVPSGQSPQALLTILYCSTDRLSRRGAAVKNLSHS